MEELISELTEEMWDTFRINEHKDVRLDKMITFLIRKIAILQLEINKLKAE